MIWIVEIKTVDASGPSALLLKALGVGNLRRRDLQTDNSYNTYTRFGLPPTPIAMPGEASIRAALNPAQSPVLYFVARGDGTHQFSSNLVEHNRAVNKFQLHR